MEKTFLQTLLLELLGKRAIIAGFTMLSMWLAFLFLPLEAANGYKDAVVILIPIFMGLQTITDSVKEVKKKGADASGKAE